MSQDRFFKAATTIDRETLLDLSSGGNDRLTLHATDLDTGPQLVLKERGPEPRLALACMPGHRDWSPASLTYRFSEWYLCTEPSQSPAYQSKLEEVPAKLDRWTSPALNNLLNHKPLVGMTLPEIAAWITRTAADPISRLAGRPVQLDFFLANLTFATRVESRLLRRRATANPSKVWI